MAKKKFKFFDVFNIFFGSLKTYCLYLDQCTKFLVFPIFGQLFSLIIIFTLTYYFRTNYENIKGSAAFLNNDQTLFILFLIVILPFLLVFAKALYDYLIAFSSLNIMFYTVSNKKKLKDIDFKANNKVIERKLFNYIILMFIISIIMIVPPLCFIAPIIWIFLCLAFQIFALENDAGPVKSITRSAQLVKENFISTLLLLALTALLTYWFLPSVIIWALEKISVMSLFISGIENIALLLPFDVINSYLSIVNTSIDPVTIAKNTAEMSVYSIIVAFTLPFRCSCFTEFYRILDSEKIKAFSKQSDEIINRATAKKRKY